MDLKILTEKVRTSAVEVTDNIKKVIDKIAVPKPRRTNKRVDYYNIPISFDIETTSFYKFNKLKNENDKVAIMYEWSMDIQGYIILGRTWEEFITTYNILVDKFQTSERRRLVIFVHNLAYEFQFFRKLFEWSKVFALEKRKPVQCLTKDGIEFRCSYILSGYSLQKLAEQLTKTKIEKLVGDLDYKKIRHHKTPLTDEEWLYCINDVIIVRCYIEELIEQYKGIELLPLTKTGFIRNYCRNACYFNEDRKKSGNKYTRYRKLMQCLTLDSDTYLQLKRAFQGGYTHANAYYSCETLENVGSFDFSSAYPYVTVAYKFPMSSPEKIVLKSKEEFRFNLLNYCCLFDIKFINIKPKVGYENYLSESRCYGIKKAIVNNGRIVSAEELTTTITEQDFFIIDRLYEWDDILITNFKRFLKGYLPTDFIKSILNLYKDKTTLKDVEDKVVEYMQSKERINSTFGMCVTDICREEIIYNEEWTSSKPDIEDSINKYNNSVKRFLYYAWGIWITAYNRYNLFTGICEFGNDYVYSDTDSVKAINIDKHMEYINKYNENVRKRLKQAMDFHKIPYEMVEPKTIKGVTKTLGVWDFEGVYEKFKALGAKRYMTKKDGKYSMTVSGVNKHKAIPYLIKTYGEEELFNIFSDELHIPAAYISNGEEISATGKLTHTYIDFEMKGKIEDYLGVTANYHELSGVHLENADYSLSLSEFYIEYLLNIRSEVDGHTK